ncbi:MAG: metallophosphoesterase [Desulfurococcales archaeon]|nr:metallophosphoesterase [Desulfurococcales archaeon]
MLIGVMSDSHDNTQNVRRALEIFRDEGVDLIVHLGDIVSPFTLKLIAEEASKTGVKVEAVFGNNCGEKPGLLKVASKTGVTLGDPPRILELGDRRILLLHGFGDKRLTREIVDALAVSNRWDVILYGHTHEADLRRANGTLILNPGETLGFFNHPTVAVLDTERLEARIVRL